MRLLSVDCSLRIVLFVSLSRNPILCGGATCLERSRSISRTHLDIPLRLIRIIPYQYFFVQGFWLNGAKDFAVKSLREPAHKRQVSERECHELSLLCPLYLWQRRAKSREVTYEMVCYLPAFFVHNPCNGEVVFFAPAAPSARRTAR